MLRVPPPPSFRRSVIVAADIVLGPTGMSVEPKGAPPIVPGRRRVGVFCSYAPGINFQAASSFGESGTRARDIKPLYRRLSTSDVHLCTSLTESRNSSHIGGVRLNVRCRSAYPTPRSASAAVFDSIDDA